MHASDVIHLAYLWYKKSVFQKILKGDRVFYPCATAFTLPGKNLTDIVTLGCKPMAVYFCWQPYKFFRSLVLLGTYEESDELDSDMLHQTLYRKLYTAIVKLIAVVTVAVVEHMDFHAVLYVDQVKLHVVTTRRSMN